MKAVLSKYMGWLAKQDVNYVTIPAPIDYYVDKYIYETSPDAAFPIIQKVCEFLGVTIDEVKSENTKEKIRTARQLCCYFVKEKTELKLKEIGAVLNRSHVTILHSIRVVNNLKETDKQYNEMFNKLKELINC